MCKLLADGSYHEKKTKRTLENVGQGYSENRNKKTELITYSTMSGFYCIPSHCLRYVQSTFE